MMRSVIEIAREAGLGYFRILDSDNTSVDALERFANLVVEATKEKAAKVCDGYAANSSHPMNFAENCAAAIRGLK